MTCSAAIAIPVERRTMAIGVSNASDVSGKRTDVVAFAGAPGSNAFHIRMEPCRRKKWTMNSG